MEDLLDLNLLHLLLGKKQQLYRADRGACLHIPFGKLSFEADALKENFDAIVDAVQKAKPASSKGVYIISCTISGTMTPGVKINVKELARAAK